MRQPQICDGPAARGRVVSVMELLEGRQLLSAGLHHTAVHQLRVHHHAASHDVQLRNTAAKALTGDPGADSSSASPQTASNTLTATFANNSTSTTGTSTLISFTVFVSNSLGVAPTNLAIKSVKKNGSLVYPNPKGVTISAPTLNASGTYQATLSILGHVKNDVYNIDLTDDGAVSPFPVLTVTFTS